MPVAETLQSRYRIAGVIFLQPLECKAHSKPEKIAPAVRVVSILFFSDYIPTFKALISLSRLLSLRRHQIFLARRLLGVLRHR